MASSTVRVGLVQMAAGADKLANIEHALAGIADAAAQGARLVCLGELFSTPYFCQVEDAALFDLAEPMDGYTVQVVSRAARQHKVSVLISFFERRAAGLYHNSVVIAGPDGEKLGAYRKMHIPDDPQYYEKFYFTPGDLGFVNVKTPEAAVGPLICWDQWYPEAARLTALAGAELLLYPTAIGWLPQDKPVYGKDQLAAWQTVQRAHAISNGVFVVVCNRVGSEYAPSSQAVHGAGGAGSGGHGATAQAAEKAPSIEFWGHSFIADPYGRIIAEADEKQTVLVADCDLKLIEQARRGWPFLRDRRIDAYRGIEQRFIDQKP
jgi:N-carbamoylputrescine amidase